MKKTFLMAGTCAALICGGLVYASTGQRAAALVEKMTSPESEIVTSEMQRIPQHGLQIDKESLNLAASKVMSNSPRRAASDTTQNSEDSNQVVIDLWTPETSIYSFNEGGNYNASTGVLSFPGSEETTNQIFSYVTEDDYFGWYALGGQTYEFTGTLASNGEAEIRCCIIFRNDGSLLIAGSTGVLLSDENGYTADFHVSASDMPANAPILVGFLITNSSPSTVITSSNNKFYYETNSSNAEEWSSDNDLPGLGLSNFSTGTYTVKCDDGITTLGIYYNGSVYVTGINTTAEEVVLPENVTINGTVESINYFGYNNQMDWSGAPNLKKLDLSSVDRINAPFTGSGITDLYISLSTSFYNTPAGVSQMYLHLPYTSNRSDYTGYGFNRVLVGEETPDYPVTFNSYWVIAGENEGEYFGISIYNGYYCINEIFTEKEEVTLPEATPANGGYYYIRYFGNDSNYSGLLCEHAPALKSVILPESYTNIDIYWSYYAITELHMQGAVPSVSWSIPSYMTVYVGNQSNYTAYENNSNWNSASILPEGWEFEWMTVNVARKGEFAQTYIEMTDADWAYGMYVKVTGTLNATDLQNIKKLTSLRKLDLSEAVFTELPASFLENKSTVTEVYLPENLTTIPQSAFNYCKALTKVSAPGVTYIGNNAFYECNRLTDFSIANVKTLGSSAFYNCYYFNPTDISNLTSIGDYAFYNTSIRVVEIPEGITRLNHSTFYGCSLMSSITLPSTLVTIESYVFGECHALTSINIPEGVTSMGYDVFYNAYNLQEVTLPSTLQSINNDMFEQCRALTTVKCKAIVPPTTNGEFTYNVNMNKCTLYVAPFAIDAYRSASDWSNFYIMKPLEEPIKNIYINRYMTFDLQSEDNIVLQDNPNLTLDYSNTSNVGQLSASGDGTLSAGIFTLYHSFGSRQSSGVSDLRTTLINNAENMRADSVVTSISFDKNKWHFISFQYDVQMSDIYGLNETDFVIRQYNSANRALGDGTTSNWETVPADGVLKAGQGYIIQAANNTTNANGYSRLAVVRFPSRNTVTKNKLFTSSNVIVPLEEYPAEFAHNRSWNLVGNPYPCYYYMQCLQDEFTTPIVLWRGTSYQAYSPVDDNIILRPNEAFFVQRPLDAEQMVFGADGRMNFNAAYNYSNYYDMSPGIYYAPSKVVGNSNRSVFNFNIAGCGTDDRTRIVLNEEASMDYEINCDASKFFAEAAEGAEIYVDGNVKYDICERPLADGVANLGTRIGTAGEYTISLSGRNIEGWTVMLTDKVTGKIVDLSVESYTFEAEAGVSAERFTVTFAATAKTEIEDVDAATVSGPVRVVNAAGVTVFNGDFEEFKASAAPGIYIVMSADKNYKIVVK